MSRLRSLWRRLLGIVPSQQREQEFAAELDSHLELHIADNLRAGMTPREARRHAILTLGGVETTRQAYRNQATLPLVEDTLHDIRFGIRQLARNPGFAATAILILALGMCASVAIFAFVDAALIKPLPYPSPARLMDVTEQASLVGRANLSYPDFTDWKKTNTAFQSLALYTDAGYMLNSGAGTELVPGMRVTDDFFRTLGIVPILGRDFYPGEDQASAARSVLLSYATWQHRYQGSPQILGRTVDLSGLPYTVIGVLPSTFRFARRGNGEYWANYRAEGSCDLRRSCHSALGVGRLRDGVTVAAAQANMAGIADQLERQYPGSNRGQGASVIPLSEAFTGNIRPLLLTLLAGAGLLLLIAFVNVASLLLVRSEGRRREIAIRGALGASRARLSRQFLVEGLLIVSAGAALGTVAAFAAMQIMLHLLSTEMKLRMPYLEALGLNPRVFAFAGALALLAAAVFSLTPMLRLSGANVREGLAEGSRGSAGTLWARLGSNLVIVELAVAVVLLVGAGLLGKSVFNLLHVELNFEPQHLATLQVALPEVHYDTGDKQTAVADHVLDRLATLPGVQSVALTSLLPVSSNGNTDWIRFPGRPYDGKHIEINERDISPAFFTTLHARLVSGRFFTHDDTDSKPRVAIINQAFARQYFPGEDPLGKIFGDTDLSPKSLRQVIGVVEDVKEAQLDTVTWPTEYIPFAQSPQSSFSLIVRTAQPPTGVLPSIVQAVQQVDRSIGTIDESTMAMRINDSQTAYLHRSSAWLVGGFAALALLLGVVGLYGVIAYSVSMRTREIGVRMALGAQRATVYRLILTEAGWLTFWGLAAGTLCAIGAATLMRSLLFGTAAWDATTLIAVGLVLATSALLASFFPAHRAASVNPTDALRAE